MTRGTSYTKVTLALTDRRPVRAAAGDDFKIFMHSCLIIYQAVHLFYIFHVFVFLGSSIFGN